VCGLCALLAGRGGGAPNESLFATAADRVERDRNRRARIGRINQILAHYRLVLDDRGPQTLVLRAPTGRSVVLGDFSGVWAAADQLAGRPIDPLDPALLAFLEALQ
jgi:hypothetical protein